MKIANWGNYPVIDANIIGEDVITRMAELVAKRKNMIPRGLGRCYGDSSLYYTILSMNKLNHMLKFDHKNGILTCEAGVSLKDILDIFVPRGWFLPVTPGTKFVTVGGAIASDVHGKNHHKDGSFCNHVLSIDLLLSNGEIVSCSREHNKDLFWATCGGMGLTGVIVRATIKMKKIETAYILKQIFKAKNIDEVMDLFEKYKNNTYSVAWIDCLKGSNLGRSILFIGEHAKLNELSSKLYKNSLVVPKKNKITIPCFFPNFVLNKYTIKSFNAIYYNKIKEQTSIVNYDNFFYPLDNIHKWNKIYGKRGFLQYQFVLPKEVSKKGLKVILSQIAESGLGSFLGVLKLLGKNSGGLLSFPLEGYTLALDFPISQKVFELLEKLDKIVLDYGGKIYLSKDARMKKEIFHKSYSSNLEKFLQVKYKFDPNNKFQSLQSQRLGV